MSAQGTFQDDLSLVCFSQGRQSGDFQNMDLTTKTSSKCSGKPELSRNSGHFKANDDMDLANGTLSLVKSKL